MTTTAIKTITFHDLTHMKPGQTIGPFTDYGWDHEGTECMVVSSGTSSQETDKPWVYLPQRHLWCACGIKATGTGPAAEYGTSKPADWEIAERACVAAFLAEHGLPA